jgi:hypothetical protein
MGHTWRDFAAHSSAGGLVMKVNIEVDCTPEEVRRLVGLPDLSEVHAAYLTQMKDTMKKGLSPEMVEGMVRNWVPMGVAGVDMVKDLIGAFSSGSGGKGKKS